MNYIQRVYGVVRQIPRGKVSTYGDIARLVNDKSRVSARMVGWALHGNRDLQIPCHRVVNKDGRVAAGYAFGGGGEQRRKLELEGVAFVELERVDLGKHRWLGVISLSLCET